MKHSTKSLLLYVLNVSLATVARASCYYPDGSLNTKTDYQPCRSNTPFTMCCATNRTTPDTCMVNGLCMAPQDDGVEYWRESCTDPTWKSPYCLASLCASGAQSTNDQQVSQCPDGSWCCNPSGIAFIDCCNNKKGLQLPAVVGMSLSAMSTSTTRGTGSSPTAPVAPINANASADGGVQSTSSSVGREVSIGLGSAAGAFLISGILAFLYFRSQKMRQQKAYLVHPPAEFEDAKQHEPMKYDVQQYVQHAHELHAPQPLSELHEPQLRPELQ